MLKKFFLPLLLLGVITVQAQTKKPTPVKKPASSAKTSTSAVTFKTQADSLSYAMGLSVGQYLKAQGVANLNYVLLNKAIEQTLKNAPTSFNMQEGNAVMERSAMSKIRKGAAAEREKSRQFLQQNKTKPGVVQTASGLQYEILVNGQGPKPALSDTVVVHYAGKLLNGKEFDSSYARGEPISIAVTGVIPGWTEALQLMPTGSKWRLFIPSTLGYGDNGAGRDIPGGAALVFDVELLQIGSKKAK